MHEESVSFQQTIEEIISAIREKVKVIQKLASIGSDLLAHHYENQGTLSVIENAIDDFNYEVNTLSSANDYLSRILESNQQHLKELESESTKLQNQYQDLENSITKLIPKKTKTKINKLNKQLVDQAKKISSIQQKYESQITNQEQTISALKAQIENEARVAAIQSTIGSRGKTPFKLLVPLSNSFRKDSTYEFNSNHNDGSNIDGMYTNMSIETWKSEIEDFTESSDLNAANLSGSKTYSKNLTIDDSILVEKNSGSSISNPFQSESSIKKTLASQSEKEKLTHDSETNEEQLINSKSISHEVYQQFQTSHKLSKQQKKKKGEYLKKLNEENKQLRNLIIELERKISTKEAENSLLQNQLTFFKQQLPASQDQNAG
ncbi:hypothetical protein GPJ56_007094 [Histomonas meleagridis]|uniref:uncharacterized protein n=1 Tax=Histomonas meleagridis TaxID=135588 RepID=UPI003559792C|nr:hypothetical protein GPJ56_007094 [Histomonas meleagridis]KAH0799807.1 hypothetical protein GO595_007528 [Histomonas meleagridis]